MMTSALIVTNDEMYELECINDFQVPIFGNQAITVRDMMGNMIGIIMQGDLKTLQLIASNLSDKIVGKFIMTHLTKGILYSDDPDKDGIEVMLEHVIIT